MSVLEAMSVLELRGVSKTYGAGAAEVQALRDVDLSVQAGAMVAVMGPSGSGKSTLLTIAGSLEDPTSGEVLVGGAALSGMSRNDKARLLRHGTGTSSTTPGPTWRRTSSSSTRPTEPMGREVRATDRVAP